MAEETSCTSVEFEEGGVTSSYTSCWNYSVPDLGWKSSDVLGGLPRPLNTGARSWRTCKYFLNGMPAVCGHFDGSNQKCNQQQNSAGTADAQTLPTGYNAGRCDYLGRQASCNRYTAGTQDDLDQYICILPNMYLSGVGRQVETEPVPFVRSVKLNEISGYNDNGQGVGQCDCYGMGRGSAGCAKVGVVKVGNTSAEQELSKLPVKCNYYRPFAMGFGAISPHEARRKDGSIDVVKLTEMMEKNEPLSYRLPFSFEVFNLRARFQRCLWYETESDSAFDITSQGLVVLDNDGAFTGDKLTKCKCTDTASEPYNTRDTTGYDVTNLMANVWAKAGTVICNGAKPECPCYTGKWYYCTDEKMWDGMPVTAQQIMELRFWSYDWDTQKEYDDYYLEKPNPDDTSRPEIYTFTKWENISANTEYMKMHGKKVSMCQPAPLQMKEFIPDKYLKIEKITYDNFGTNTTSQTTFPNLIRDPRFPNIKPLTVIYPYSAEEAFDNEVCSPNTGKTAYRKKTNETQFDYIYVIGQTIPYRQVYVINMTGVGKQPDIILNKANPLTMTPDQKAALTKNLESYISDVEEHYNQYLRTGFSDSKSGVFVIDPVELKFGSNNLLICVDFGGSDFGFKKREVVSLWCGGIAVQTIYDYSNASETKDETRQPEKINPPAELSAEVRPLGGSQTVETFPVRSVMIPNIYTGDKTYYSYSMYWEETTEDKVTKVCSVGNSSYIWAEIANTFINSIFDFEVLEATATIIEKNSNGEEITKTVTLDKVDLDYRYIPPNACLFKPKESNVRFRFIPSKCSLSIKYKYQMFIHGPVPSGKTGVHGGGMSDTQLYADVKYTYELSGSSLQIKNISNETLAFMFLFKDEYGRIVSTVATKFMPYIIRPSCRNVEIRYIYKADGKEYVLIPETGFCVDIAGDRLTGRMVSHISDPICGDHLLSPAGRGPLWFPYDRCGQYDFYDVFTFANYCTAPIDVGPENKGLLCADCGPGGTAMRLDHRYRSPDKYQATAQDRGNWAATCNCGWKFYYSDASAATILFTGYANIKGVIDEKYYNAEGWRLPPFGNEGRELLERYLSQSYIHYYDFQDPTITRHEWAPFVMDNTAFYLEFDAFTTNDITYNIDFSSALGFSDLDNFRHVNQLNFMTYDKISEVIGAGSDISPYSRKRFDEIFQKHVEGNCTYPPPVMAAGNTTSVTFYQFLNENTVWAWQELWKEVERNIQSGKSSERLDFISEYERPPYVFSLFKEEVRLICTEGSHEIVYTGPIMAEESTATEGQGKPETGGASIETYPSVSLDGVNKKSFEIIYGSPDGNGIWTYDANAYNDSSVDWKIEGASGKKDGSSEEGNIYEDCFGPSWVFSLDERFKNMLFDSSATSSQESETDNDFYSRQNDDGTYEKLKYNTGMMVRIPKNRLIYLPKDKIDETITVSNTSASSTSFTFTVTSGAELDSQQSSVVGNTWLGSAIFDCPTSNAVISKVSIKGKYGRIIYDDVNKNKVERTYVIPGFTLVGTTNDGETGYAPRGLATNSSDYTLLTRSNTSNATELKDYELIFKFPMSPIEMIYKKFQSFIMTLHSNSNYFINVSEIRIETAKYKTETSENIKVWERKYMTSEGALNWKNLDGTESLLRYKHGGGVHFPFSSYPDEIIKSQDKMRGVFCDVPYYGMDKDIKIAATYDNLFTVEVDEQEKLYNKSIALDPDATSMVYRSICPPPLNIFFNQVVKTIDYSGLGSALFILSNVEWSKHYLVKQFLQTEFWRTGGHFYKWSDTFQYQSCMVGWHNYAGVYATDFEETFTGSFKHVDHTGYGNKIAGAEEPVDPGNSYYSLRFYYEQARYERYENVTGQTPDAGGDLVSKANILGYTRPK
jgi:hypothetical protein